jgi:hypothetical protein
MDNLLNEIRAFKRFVNLKEEFSPAVVTNSIGELKSTLKHMIIEKIKLNDLLAFTILRYNASSIDCISELLTLVLNFRTIRFS